MLSVDHWATLTPQLQRNIQVVGDCWLWTAHVTPAGYGKVKTGSLTDGTRATRLAHRVVYELLIAPIPDGLELDHVKERCTNRHCVNPAHLEPVTHRENMLRGDTVGARSAAATHCPSGHPYEGENLHIWRGRRFCRQCKSDRNRRNYEARKASAQCCP